MTGSPIHALTFEEGAVVMFLSNLNATKASLKMVQDKLLERRFDKIVRFSFKRREFLIEMAFCMTSLTSSRS